MKNSVQEAEKIARVAHSGQFSRDGVTPYITHVEKVVDNVKWRGGDDKAIITAWLHDVIEDTSVSYETLSNFFTADILDAVKALTHDKEGETYPEAIDRAAANPISRLVKIADNLANLSEQPSDKQIKKYAASLTVLINRS